MPVGFANIYVTGFNSLMVRLKVKGKLEEVVIDTVSIP